MQSMPWGPALVLVAGVVLAVLSFGPSEGPTEDTAHAFLARHWQYPLPPQGNPPPHRSQLEASLGAESCGECHAEQFRDWRDSRHAYTMQAGILWQFDLFGQAESNRCMQCHAPLAEQKALVAQDQGWQGRPEAPRPGYVPAELHHQGLTCAACHVRGHVRHGPPSNAGVRGDAPGLPHDGFVASPFFGDSRFCSTCHQFPEDGPRLNGKLRQDTYNEWKASRYAAEGVTCQECHMPGRRHLWRGISESDMVRQALAVNLHVEPDETGQVHVRASIANVGAGHLFPTYLVPRVDAGLWVEDPQGASHPLAQHIIQWRASVDLEHEEFDSRLGVDEEVTLESALPLPAEPGWRVRLSIDVAPKEHYERVYRDMLRQAHLMEPATRGRLRQALEEAEASRYRALDLVEDLPVTGG
jgi:hypothetical protein